VKLHERSVVFMSLRLELGGNRRSGDSYGSTADVCSLWRTRAEGNTKRTAQRRSAERTGIPGETRSAERETTIAPARKAYTSAIWRTVEKELAPGY
jgi:hypothetical protein